MRIGILGGSFNPPHLAHLIVAESIREQAHLDQILWIPAAQPPHKTDTDLADAAHRLAMTRLAVQDHPGFEVSTIEIDRRGTSFTLDTVKTLQTRQPDDHFSLIIGGDSLQNFHTWFRPEAIVERVPLLAYARPGADLSRVEPWVWEHTILNKTSLILPLSSTEIRNRRKAGWSIRYLVPESVRQYILEHELYL